MMENYTRWDDFSTMQQQKYIDLAVWAHDQAIVNLQACSGSHSGTYLDILLVGSFANARANSSMYSDVDIKIIYEDSIWDVFYHTNPKVAANCIQKAVKFDWTQQSQFQDLPAMPEIRLAQRSSLWNWEDFGLHPNDILGISLIDGRVFNSNFDLVYPAP